ncbi:hypothetical protein MHU86_22891 [Fragilaria crotonensis]|nr:hypothetical protein MHU86_22891 [Fragilaria crotonensis]
MNRFDSDPSNMEIYNRLTPIATDTVNDSLTSCPILNTSYSELCNCFIPKIQLALSENYPPTNVVIFQGSPLQAPTYCFGSQLKLLPTQQLTAKPIHPDQVNDPDWIPRHTADLRRHPDADLYHVACDPKRIPFSLAVRLIPVYTTGPSGQTIYQAWALPHLDNALRDPELQLFNNFLSYYHTAKENHPEFPFIDLMGSDSPVPNYDHDSEEEQAHSTHIPDALTSSTRTDFTYPPIEDLTKTLLKYAKNANLRKLAYPTFKHAADI